MVAAYSTSSVHPRDRVSYWVEVATKAFYKHEFRSSVGQSYFGELHSGLVGRLWAGRCKCDPCDVSREQRDIARDNIDGILLSVRRSGTTLLAQGDRDAVHQAGTMILLDPRRPAKMAFQSLSDSVFVVMPREPLLARLGHLGALTGRPIPVDGPIAGLAAGFISLLVERAGTINEAAGLKLGDHAMDLVALAFSTEVGLDGLTLSSPRAVALARLKAVIEARLCSFGLKPGEVAAEAGMSVRYANHLLSQEGYSIERYILHRRLERCRRALEDPKQARRRIGEIAFAWGFSDLSHFTRRFRAAYGLTPGDWRRRALESELAAAPALATAK